MTISATCTVQDGGGSPVDPTGVGVDVTPGDTITIRLANTSGVDVWNLTVLGTDETISAPTLTVNSTTKTATYTAPGSTGTATLFQSKVTSLNGVDPNTGSRPYVVTATFTVHTLVSGRRVGALGETFESNATFGTAAKVNPAIRTVGGGSTPTGTGLPHIVGGVQNAAASLVVDADVDPAAAIVGSKLAANLAVTTSVAIGTNPASAGAVRLPNNQWLVSRNGANSGDINLVKNDNADAIQFGDINANTIVFQAFSSANIYFRFSGNDSLAVYSASIRAIQPIIGEDNFYSSPYAVHGSISLAATDANWTEVKATYKFANIIYTGALTLGRTVTYPLPASNAASYHKSIFNNTTGGFAITFTNTGGTTVAVAAGKTAILVFEPAGVRRLTADV